MILGMPFYISLDVKSNDTEYGYHLQVDRNFGKAVFDEEVFEIAIITANVVTNPDQSKWWHYRFLGHSAIGHLTYGFINTQNGFEIADSWALVTAPDVSNVYTRPLEVDGGPIQSVAAQPYDLTPFNISGPYKIQASALECPSIPYNSQVVLGGDCVGKILDFEMIVFSVGTATLFNSDSIEGGTDAINMNLVLSNGDVGCLAELSILVSSSKVDSISTSCFGQHDAEDKIDYALDDAIVGLTVSIPAYLLRG